MPEIASAFVTIAPSMKGFRSGVTREAGSAGGGAGKKFAAAFAAAAGVSAGIALIKNSIAEAVEAQKVGAVTNQIIKATGRAAKVSAAQVGDLSTKLSEKAGVDDEAIQSGANLLLTFKNVRNEVGKGSNIFDRATTAAVDLSAAGFGSIESGSKMLGKALNDPVKGITALSRAGVTFTDQQKDQIKKLVASGKTLRAQKIILREVESQVGGTAEASATAGEKMAVSWGNIQEQIGTALLPTLEDFVGFAQKELVPVIEDATDYLNDNRDEIRDTAKEWGGRFLGALKDVWKVAKPVAETIDKIPGPLKEMAIQAGLFAGAAKRIGLLSLTSNLAAFGATAADTSKKTDAAARSLGRFAGAARNAAGIGGMVALTQAGDQSSDAMGGLLSVMGGAGVGFMLAGPWGALAGGVAGAAKALWDTEKAMKQTAENAATLNSNIGTGVAQRLKEEAKDYLRWALTLNNAGQLTADTVKRLRNLIESGGKDNNLLTSLSSEMETLGLTSKVVVKAMTGNKDAMREVALAMVEADKAKGGVLTVNDALKALRTNARGITSLSPHVQTFMQGWSKNRSGLSKAQQDIQGVFRATKNFRDEVRKPIRTLFRTNAPDTTLEIAKVAKQYKLTPSEIDTVISLSGVDTTRAHISNLVRQLAGLPPSASRAGERAGQGLAAGTGKGLRENRNKWIGPFTDALTGTEKQARDGGKGAGKAMAEGMAAGITENISVAALAARTLATRAKYAAERDLGIRSPSRVFAGIGKNVVLGFAQGVDRNSSVMEGAMGRVVSGGVPDVPVRGVRYTGSIGAMDDSVGIPQAPAAVPAIGVVNVQAHDYQDFERQITQRKQRLALGGWK